MRTRRGAWRGWNTRAGLGPRAVAAPVWRHFHRALLSLLLVTAGLPDSLARADQLADTQALIQLKVQFQAEYNAGRYAEAEATGRRMLTLAQRAFPGQAAMMAAVKMNLAQALEAQAKYADVLPMNQEILAVMQREAQGNPLAIITAQNNLATTYAQLQSWKEAEPLFRQALQSMQTNKIAEYPLVARTTYNLATALTRQQRYAEAEPFANRAIKIQRAGGGPDDLELMSSLELLAQIYDNTRRAPQAEPLLKEALAVRERKLGPNHILIVNSLYALIGHYIGQFRDDEAEPLLERAWSICQQTLGPDHPQTVDQAAMLAAVYLKHQRYADAKRVIDQVRPAINQLGLSNPLLEGLRITLVMVTLMDMHLDDARQELLHMLADKERAVGTESPELLFSLTLPASVNLKIWQDTEAADKFLARAERIADRHDLAPGQRAGLLDLRSELDWRAGNRDAAVRKLEQAMDAALLVRKVAAGAEHDLAKLLATSGGLFQRMVDWQAVLGNVDKAFRAAELARARGLLDQLDLAGVDLLAGVADSQAEVLRRKLVDAQQCMAECQSKLTGIGRPGGISASDKTAQAAARARLEQAQHDYAEVYRDVRSASPAFRQTVSKDREPIGLDELQRQLNASNTALLYYMLGSEKSHLLVAGPGQPAKLLRLSLDAALQEQLGIAAPELTTGVLEQILNARHDRLAESITARVRSVIKAKPAPPAQDALLEQLQDPATSTAAYPRLAGLWQALVPAETRSLLLSDSVQCVIVIPDGPLALLPFETLIVTADAEPRFLLDAGPPIVYAPSGTVLQTLANRTRANVTAAKQPVLTVGDPAYETGGREAVALRADTRTSAGGRTRFLSRDGLHRLPHSQFESQWVADVFIKSGMPAAQLIDKSATEASVRANVAGRRVLHFACHGLADQSAGNLFGALAFAPGPKAASDPSDDGLLTLPEIYALPLQGCELSILSACSTNYGPEQEGEGVWALSRGFLVAGSRRVVASNWVVSDEAAASLISYFCGGVADGQKKGTVDYARSLHAAKRWVRSQNKWQSPFYWAPFVLVGAP